MFRIPVWEVETGGFLELAGQPLSLISESQVPTRGPLSKTEMDTFLKDDSQGCPLISTHTHMHSCAPTNTCTYTCTYMHVHTHAHTKTVKSSLVNGVSTDWAQTETSPRFSRGVGEQMPQRVQL